jgi:4'-phosphopantetheinyl transferase
MQMGCGKKKWAVPSPFLLLIGHDHSRKWGRNEGIPGLADGAGAQDRRVDCPFSISGTALVSLIACAGANTISDSIVEMDAFSSGEAAPAAPSHELPSAVPGVRLWWCGLERTGDELARIGGWLSPEETARAGRFGTAALRERWIAGRTSLRILLGDVLGVAPAEVALRSGPRGRPELADAASGIDFNVSHTREVALIGIATNLSAATRIGVDVERIDRDVSADRLATKFLTAREQATLVEAALNERRLRFLRYWTCKEAMSKATGDGLAAPFRHLDVDLSAAPCLIGGPPPYLPARWSLRCVDVPKGWLATLAIWQGPDASE